MGSSRVLFLSHSPVTMQFIILSALLGCALAAPADDSPAALAYVHDVTGDAVPAPVVAAAPVAYAGYPYVAGCPFAYAGFPVAAYAGACINNFGLAVPCAQV